MRYDPLGRLYEVASASGTTRLLYDGDALVAEYNAAGAAQHVYVHATGADTPVVWYTPTDIRFLHTDQQGSIVAVSSLVDNSVVGVNSYDEYGIPRAGNVGRFQYTGQAWLAELGMYHYKARIYSPTLGRFLQTDPIGYDDQLNLYAYAGNDPINATDPDGRQTVSDMQREEEEFDRSLSGKSADQMQRAMRDRYNSQFGALLDAGTFVIPAGLNRKGVRMGVARVESRQSGSSHSRPWTLSSLRLFGGTDWCPFFLNTREDMADNDYRATMGS